MSKTIEEILKPKPEVRPRIYAYSIYDAAQVAAPTARPNPSPGQRPGLKSREQIPALKGRLIGANHSKRYTARFWNATASRLMNGMCGIRPPFQGFVYLWALFPGRCPGLVWSAPLGLEAPKSEITAKDYDLSINRYKEVTNEAVEHDSPKVILSCFAKLDEEVEKGRKELEGILK